MQPILNSLRKLKALPLRLSSLEAASDTDMPGAAGPEVAALSLQAGIRRARSNHARGSDPLGARS